VCVVCSSCRSPEDIIKRCHGRNDTVCNVAAHVPVLKPNKKNRPQLPSKNATLKKSATSEDENLPFFESESSYNFMLHPGSSDSSEENNDAVKVKNIKHKLRKNDSRVNRGGFIELSNTKFLFDKNGKHIKKDLSSADEIFSDSNQSSFQYTVKLKPSNSPRNSLFKKSKSKQKKNKDSALLDKDDEWMRHVVPHVENHRIVVDVKEGTKSQKKNSVLELPSSERSDELKQTLAIVLRAAEHLKNKTRLLDFDVQDRDVLKRTYENVVEEEDTDDDDDDDNANEDDADDDDEDEDEDEDDADDDDNDEDEDEDDDDESEDVKDRDEDEDFVSSFTKKIVPFGVDSNILPMSGDNKADDDDPEAFLSKNNKWSAANEVNVEPFIDTSNWQLLILVSAVSACLLFFVVVNAYLCIYMKKWRHMKQDFEAGTLRLSLIHNQNSLAF
jgi:hypothetical protein